MINTSTGNPKVGHSPLSVCNRVSLNYLLLLWVVQYQEWMGNHNFEEDGYHVFPQKSSSSFRRKYVLISSSLLIHLLLLALLQQKNLMHFSSLVLLQLLWCTCDTMILWILCVHIFSLLILNSLFSDCQSTYCVAPRGTNSSRWDYYLL